MVSALLPQRTQQNGIFRPRREERRPQSKILSCLPYHAHATTAATASMHRLSCRVGAQFSALTVVHRHSVVAYSQLPLSHLQSSCVHQQAHRHFATFRSGGSSLNSSSPYKSSRNSPRNSGGRSRNTSEFEEIRYDDDGAEDDEPDADEMKQDSALWNEIAAANEKRPNQTNQYQKQQQRQTPSDVAPSSSTYTAYRPYSDPRSSPSPSSSSFSPPASSSSTTPPQPRYTSSRQTPAQLAFSSRKNNTNDHEDERTSKEATFRRNENESKDASARNRYAQKHGLGGTTNQNDVMDESPLQESANNDFQEFQSRSSRDQPQLTSSSSSDWQSNIRSNRNESQPHRSNEWNEQNSNNREKTNYDRADREDQQQQRPPRRASQGGNHFDRRSDSKSGSGGWSDRSPSYSSSSSPFNSRNSNDQPTNVPSSVYWRDRQTSSRQGYQQESSESRFERSKDRSGSSSSYRNENNNRNADTWNDRRDYGNSGRFEQSNNRNRGRSSNYEDNSNFSQPQQPHRSHLISPVRGELLYGYHPILAALTQGRRQCYELYLQENKAERVERGGEETDSLVDMDLDHTSDRVPNLPAASNNATKSDKPSSSSSDPLLSRILSLATSLRIPITYLPRHDMNIASENRPHNGFLLDAQELDVPVVHAPIDLLPHIKPLQKGQEQQQRGEIWLLLDEIQDPQNLGAMLRSARYFGVDGAMIAKNSTNLSPLTSKASSGAQEEMKLVHVASVPKLLHKMRKYSELGQDSWTIVGLTLSQKSIDLRELNAELKKLEDVAKAVESNDSSTPYSSSSSASASSPRRRHVVLVVGHEGRGLRHIVAENCHIQAKIHGRNITNETHPDKRSASPLVDSLNVSNALAVALYQITART